MAQSPERPQELQSQTRSFHLGCGVLYITVGLVEGQLYEAFLQLGNAGSCSRVMTEAVGRLVSYALQGGLGAEGIIHHLEKLSCPSGQWEDGALYQSCMDAVAATLRDIAKPDP